MTEPAPTQTRHPWRATTRTVFAAVVAFLTLLPYVFTEANIPTEGAVAQILAVTGTVTRVLAIPAVNVWITEYVPWLAPVPKRPATSGTSGIPTPPL